MQLRHQRARRSLVVVTTLLAVSLALLGNIMIARPAQAAAYQPSWWNGDCNGQGQLITTDANTGLQVCYPPSYSYPTQPDSPENGYWNVNYPLPEWQCTELSGRYLAQYRNMPPQSGTGNGVDLVTTYYNWYHSTRPDISTISGGQAQAPAVGDVISESQSSTSREPGHTAVISSVNIDGSGNGTVMIVEQNVKGWNYGWNADGSARTQTQGPWPDNAAPYTKLQVSGWTYYDADFSNPLQNPLYDVTILHFGSPPASNTINTQDVVTVGADSQLYDYHWQQSGNWVVDSSMNSLTPQGVHPQGRPADNAFPTPAGEFQHAIVVGSDHQLYEYYQPINSSWRLHDLSTLAPPPAGVTFVGSPDSYSYVPSGQTSAQHSIFVLGSNNHLYYYAWTPGGTNGTWTLTDITQQVPLPSGVTPTGTPAGNVFPTPAGEFQHAIVVGSNGHLYEYYQPLNGTWQMHDLSTLAAPPAGVTFVGSPASFSYVLSGQTSAQHSIFVLGSDNQLYNYAWTPGGTNGTWTLTDITQQLPLPSGVTPTGTPAGNAFMVATSEYQHALVVGSDGHLYEFYQPINGTWGSHDLYTLTSSTVTVTGSPLSYSYVLQGQTAERHSVQVVTIDGHFREYLWVQGSGSGTWSINDHGTPTSTTTNTGSPSGDAYTS